MACCVEDAGQGQRAQIAVDGESDLRLVQAIRGYREDFDLSLRQSAPAEQEVQDRPLGFAWRERAVPDGIAHGLNIRSEKRLELLVGEINPGTGFRGLAHGKCTDIKR